jgi:hypothetical protein
MPVKQLIVAVLLLALLGQTLNRAFIVTSYYVNQGAFARNCENKARPKMHCNGRCQMMKKLRQEENKDKQNPERRSSYDEVLSSKSFFATVEVYSAPLLQHVAVYRANVPSPHPRNIFHPPGA